MPEVVRRVSGSAVPARYAEGLERILAMAAHPGVELSVAWVEELSGHPAAERPARAARGARAAAGASGAAQPPLGRCA